VRDIEQFQFGDREIRVIDRDGEPWWVALDVCRALGMSEPHRALSRLDDDDRHSMTVLDGRGIPQQTTVINEPGLYTLILRSRKPEAVAFKQWVTHEVLPSIRRTGGYQAAPADVDMTVTLRFAEAWHKEHVVPASGRILAYQRWNKPQEGMKAFGEICVQLELDIAPGTAGEITGADND